MPARRRSPQSVGGRVALLIAKETKGAGSVWSSGREAGQFATPVHDLTMDCAGSIYTGEAATAGRIQKFTRRE